MLLNNLEEFLFSPEFWINAIVGISTIALLVAVFIDFSLYEEKNKIKDKLKSKVATGRMLLFFLFVYLVIRFQIGVYFLPITNNYIIYGILFLGLIITVFSAFFNILGRFYLKTNWANNIKIYDDHSLVNTGPYKIVRHPLYASLIWINYGLGLVYSNWLVFVLGTFVFLPMMYYRARQEEKLLIKNFPKYREYKQNVGMFFPKIF